MEQNQGGKAVQTKCQGLISQPFTHTYARTHTHNPQNVDGTDHQCSLEKNNSLKIHSQVSNK